MQCVQCVLTHPDVAGGHQVVPGCSSHGVNGELRCSDGAKPHLPTRRQKSTDGTAEP